MNKAKKKYGVETFIALSAHEAALCNL